MITNYSPIKMSVVSNLIKLGHSYPSLQIYLEVVYSLLIRTLDTDKSITRQWPPIVFDSVVSLPTRPRIRIPSKLMRIIKFFVATTRHFNETLIRPKNHLLLNISQKLMKCCRPVIHTPLYTL